MSALDEAVRRGFEIAREFAEPSESLVNPRIDWTSAEMELEEHLGKQDPEVVSSVRVAIIGGHAYIAVWNRGGKAGELVVDALDAREFLRRLSPKAMFADSKEAEALVRELEKGEGQ